MSPVSVSLALFFLICSKFLGHIALDSETADESKKPNGVKDLTFRVNHILRAYYDDWKTENALEYKKSISGQEEEVQKKNVMRLNNKGLRVCTQAFLQSLLRYLCVTSSPARLSKKGNFFQKFFCVYIYLYIYIYIYI